MRIDVPVRFSGIVVVDVPDHLGTSLDAVLLANKVALARVVATTVNPDAPEEDALDEYKKECSNPETAEADWDACKMEGVGGGWNYG